MLWCLLGKGVETAICVRRVRVGGSKIEVSGERGGQIRCESTARCNQLPVRRPSQRQLGSLTSCVSDPRGEADSSNGETRGEEGLPQPLRAYGAEGGSQQTAGAREGVSEAISAMD